MLGLWEHDQNSLNYIEEDSIMDNESVHKILQNDWWKRDLLPWEHAGKKFYDISVEYIIKNIERKTELRCFYNDQVYYFNIGTEEPEITEEMINNGKWQVYTWSD